MNANYICRPTYAGECKLLAHLLWAQMRI